MQVLDVLRNTSADLLYGDIDIWSADSRVGRRWISGLPSGLKLRLGWIPPHPAVFMRRPVFIEMGGFNTLFQNAGDYELLLRTIRIERKEVQYLPVTMVSMEAGGRSNRSIAAIMEGMREVAKAWKVNSLHFGWVAASGKLLRKITQFRPGVSPPYRQHQP